MIVKNGDTNVTVKTWQKTEIELQAEKQYGNPYTDVDVWVDLHGPNFDKRVYGFWDGKNSFKVRVTATGPGTWTWESGSNTSDTGLSEKKGSFLAEDWSKQEKQQNPLRRGFLKPSPNGRIFLHADGTPFLLIGDTWWASPTFRYPWYDNDKERPIGPEMGFKDMLRFRKEQGFNCIAIIASLPHWANDGEPAVIRLEDEKNTALRQAWGQAGTKSAKDMHNEGGRPFEFPGKVPGYEQIVPDFDRINPDYFKYMDRKIDYLNKEGFVAFIEVARRDVSEVWKNYYDWPDSYARYIQYIFARYQANNCLLSPIHFDSVSYSIPSREYNEPANMVHDTYGPPPFGTLLGTNAAPSTLTNFGGPDEARWLTFHQIGNDRREHVNYWYLTEIFNSEPARPAINGEPYYPGFPDDSPPADTEEAELNCRSGMYGSFLSGGLAGYIYGVQGIWGGDIENDAKYKMWESIQFKSGAMVGHLRKFAGLKGTRYHDLVPEHEMIIPNKSGDHIGFRGWAFCARTEEKDFALLYFEKDCAPAMVRALQPNRQYMINWFDPRSGEWLNMENPEIIETDQTGRVELPDYPTNNDWGLCLSIK